MGEGRRGLSGGVATRPPILLTSGNFFSGQATLVQPTFIYSFICLVLSFSGKTTRQGQGEGEKTGLD